MLPRRRLESDQAIKKWYGVRAKALPRAMVKKAAEDMIDRVVTRRWLRDVKPGDFKA